MLIPSAWGQGRHPPPSPCSAHVYCACQLVTHRLAQGHRPFVRFWRVWGDEDMPEAMETRFIVTAEPSEQTEILLVKTGVGGCM